MKQEEKDLLFQDLCVRLPYGVKISVPSWDGEKQECIDKVDVLYSVNRDEYIKSTNEDYDFNIEDIKPYLFPLSSMTDEDKFEFRKLTANYDNKESMGNFMFRYEELLEELEMIGFFPYEIYDWLNKNHFDYRGLIERGLAIDATGLNIY